MADEKSNGLKIAIIVICLAGAAAGLYFAFAPTGGPVMPEGANEPVSPQDQGIGDVTEEQLEEVTGGA